jgi:hypothetical protein
MTTFVVIESITPNQSLVFSAQQGPQGIGGATGPTGPTGPVGATGPQGETGATGVYRCYRTNWCLLVPLALLDHKA